MHSKVRKVLVGAMTVLILASAPAIARKKAPPPPPPPPPPAPAPRYVYVDWKPLPPEHASPVLVYPELGPDGVRRSVNRGISPAQATWNLRAAFNVAALNCREPKHAGILVNYRAFLKTHAKTLRATNAKVDAEWRAKYGPRFIPVREKYMTEVYNHYAIPPIQPAFCDAALAAGNDARKVKSAKLDQFAATALPSIEIVFDDFFRRYDDYRVQIAAWEAKWGKDAVPGSRVLESSIPASSSIVAAAR